MENNPNTFAMLQRLLWQSGLTALGVLVRAERIRGKCKSRGARSVLAPRRAVSISKQAYRNPHQHAYDHDRKEILLL